jgi:hypothetical protein
MKVGISPFLGRIPCPLLYSIESTSQHRLDDFEEQQGECPARINRSPRLSVQAAPDGGSPTSSWAGEQGDDVVGDDGDRQERDRSEQIAASLVIAAAVRT